MKIWKVSFNDGGWYSSDRPSFMVVADSTKEAIEKVLAENPQYKKGWDVWCVEFKIQGYVIEVYDEKTYNRDKNLDNIIGS
jgi:hypothetical protein